MARCAFDDVLRLHREEEKTLQAARLLKRLVGEGAAPRCFAARCDSRPGAAGARWEAMCYSAACRARSAALAEIVHQADTVTHLRRELETTDGWEVHRDSHGIRTLSRRSDGDPNVMIRVEGHVDARLLAILSVFYEVDMWTEWVPSLPVMGLRDCAMLEDHSATRFTVHMTVNAPWPINTRDMLVAVQGIDCMDPHEVGPDAGQHRQVVVLLNSTDQFWSGSPTLPPDSGVTRMDVSVGALVLTPSCINDGGAGTHLAIISRIDPKLDYIPSSLINLAAKYMCGLFFERLKSRASSIEGTEYESRIAAGGRFYDYIREKMDAIGFPEEQR